VRKVTPVTPGAVVIGHTSCDGSVAFFPNDPSAGFEISARGMMELFHWFRGEHKVCLRRIGVCVF
jgi:hypothetical protein